MVCSEKSAKTFHTKYCSPAFRLLFGCFSALDLTAANFFMEDALDDGMDCSIRDHSKDDYNVKARSRGWLEPEA